MDEDEAMLYTDGDAMLYAGGTDRMLWVPSGIRWIEQPAATGSWGEQAAATGVWTEQPEAT